MNGIAELYRLRLAETIAAGDTTPMMVFPIGEWHSALYPDLPLTEDLANELIANFESGILGTEPVVDSSGKHDTSVPAAGWVKRVYLASYEEDDVTGLALWADVKWTTIGATMLSDDQYKYGSVEIGPVVTNEKGDKVDNVLRSLTLTNTPVLRLMPGVKNAAEKQRVAVTLSLSEVTLAEAGSVNDRREALEQAVKDAFGAMHEGIYIEDFGPDWVVFHTWSAGLADGHYYRVTYDGTTFGPPVEVERDTTYVPVTDSSPAGAQPASSTALSPDAKATEGQGAHLAEGAAATKGSDPMKTVAIRLNLAEDASEALVLAEVVKLAEHDAAETKRADTAELKLAETEKASSIAAFTIKLDEKIKTENTVSPGQRDYFLGLADRNMVEAELALASHTVKVIDLTERGSGTEGDDKPTKRADVELAERTRARMAKDSISYSQAKGLELSENTDLAARYDEFLTGKEA